MPQGREEIEEDDMFTALEKIQQERLGGAVDSGQSSDETVAPPQLRRNIAVYEAARALLGYLTPDFDEISKVPDRTSCNALMFVWRPRQCAA